MEFMSSPTGPMRDHYVVHDSSVVASLAAKASKATLGRSAEQAHTDHRQATGYTSAGPVSFGTYECGRSSMPKNARPTSVFMSGVPLGLLHSHMDGYNDPLAGDPGEYDPYTLMEISHRTSFSHNKTRRSFGSLSTREQKVYPPRYGEGVPGPGTYNAAEAQRKQHGRLGQSSNRSVFVSGCPQRPVNATLPPGPDRYTPNMNSVDPNLRGR